MIRRLIAAFVAVCAIGGIGAAGASATSEFFYHENTLANTQSVSSVPKNTIFFVGAYKGFTGEYSIGLCNPVNCATGVGRRSWGSGTSLTESFPAEAGRGWLENESGKTGTFTAEIRY
jgi:hypothetical protein